MAIIMKYDFEEIERLLKEEVTRRYMVEIEDIDWNTDEEYVEVTLGAVMPPQRGGEGDR